MPSVLGHGFRLVSNVASLDRSLAAAFLGEGVQSHNDTGGLGEIGGGDGMSVDQAIAKIHELKPQDAQMASRRVLQDQLFPGALNITPDEREAAEAIAAAGRALEAWVLRRKILHSELHNYYEKSMRCAVEVADVENKLMARATKRKAKAEAHAASEEAAKTAAKMAETLLSQKRHKDTLERVMQRQRMFEGMAKSEQKKAAELQAKERVRLEEEAEKADKELNSPRSAPLEKATVTSQLQLDYKAGHRGVAHGVHGQKSAFQDTAQAGSSVEVAARRVSRRNKAPNEATAFPDGDGTKKKSSRRERLKKKFDHYDTSDEEREAAARAAKAKQKPKPGPTTEPPPTKPKAKKKRSLKEKLTGDRGNDTDTSVSISSSEEEPVPEISPECRNVDPSSALLHTRRAASKAYWDFDRSLQVADRAVGMALVSELQRRA
mmetsp:Transcript_2475/g.6186  ORF Transcript_2475/g.6186 Transcript_2475/m.6186 type:complete len:435 (-) Transcript_2475:57-1361(-)